MLRLPLTIIIWIIWISSDVLCEDQALNEFTNLEDDHINKFLSKCRLNEEDDTFNCLRRSLIQDRTKTSEEGNYKLHYAYCSWLYSLPNLSPNSVIYNEVPLEVDQSHLYENNYLEEPKFAPLYYKIKFNDYYNFLESDIKETLNTLDTKSKLEEFKNKLSKKFGLPKIVLEAKSSHTTTFDEVFGLKLIGDTVNEEDIYPRSLLLFIDYHFFRPLTSRAYILRFLNGSSVLYKLRFYDHSKRFLRKFKRHKRLLSDERYLMECVDLSKYFNLLKEKTYPFMPLPFEYNRRNGSDLLLEFTTANEHFLSLVNGVLSSVRSGSQVDLVFKLLEEYAESLHTIEYLREIPSLDSFYLFEVTAKSFGFSFYNMFPPEERKKIVNYKDCLLVASHISRLDGEHQVIQIVVKFLVMVPVAVMLSLVVLVYLVKCVK